MSMSRLDDSLAEPMNDELLRLEPDCEAISSSLRDRFRLADLCRLWVDDDALSGGNCHLGYLYLDGNCCELYGANTGTLSPS